MKVICNISVTSARWRPASWSPAALFAGGAQGAWYDPSDLGTLFQDAAGTTPVADYGDPVGLILDKSGNGNHASQASVAAKPIFARVPEGGRRNILTHSQAFNHSDWVKFRVNVTLAAGAGPGGMDAFSVVPQTGFTTAFYNIDYNRITSAGQTYSQYADLKANGYNYAILRSGSSLGLGVIFDLTAGTVVGNAPGGSGANTARVEALGDGWFRCIVEDVTAIADSTIFSVRIGALDNATGASYSADGVSGVLVARAQQEVSDVATEYQTVKSQYDVTEPGVANIQTLRFDGLDDYMTTPAIDITGDPNLALFAGFGSAGEPGIQSILGQNSTSPDGSGLEFSDTERRFRCGDGVTGHLAVISGAFAAAPYVLTGVADFSQPIRIVRSNQVSATSTAGIPGVPGAATTKWFIGAAGTTDVALENFMTGDIAQLCLVHGELLSLAKIEAMEKHVADKTGVSL